MLHSLNTSFLVLMTTERLHRGMSLRDGGARTQTEPWALEPDLSAAAVLPHCAAAGVAGPLTSAIRQSYTGRCKRWSSGWEERSGYGPIYSLLQ